MDIRELVGNRVKEMRVAVGLTLENPYQVCKALEVPFGALTDIDRKDEEVLGDYLLQEMMKLLQASAPSVVKLAHRLEKVVVEEGF